MAKAKLELSQVLWAIAVELKRWPASTYELNTLASRFSDVNQLRSWIRRNGRRGKGLTSGAPSWLINMMSGELGRDAQWLAIPDVAWVMMRGAAEGWDESKIQAAIETTTWWKGRNDTQRTWQRLLPGEKEQLIQSTIGRISQSLRELYGLDQMKSRGWHLKAADLRTWASEIASGGKPFEIWFLEQRSSAEKIEGTPAQKALVEDLRDARRELMNVEEITGQLEEEWRNWIGTGISPRREDMAAWAKRINEFANSRQDFLDHLKETAQSLYPNKPQNAPYSLWAQPAKQLIGQLLDLGDVPDDDPVLQSYVQGQIPSLAELRLRVMRDPRVAKAGWWREQQQGVGFALARGLGF